MAEPQKIVATNPKARRNYQIKEVIEAGMALQGSEVKSLRQAKAAIVEAYVRADSKGAWLVGAHIPTYAPAGKFNHDPKRARKLLVTKRQLNKWIGQTGEKGLTLVATDIHFNAKGVAKINVAVGVGLKKFDKRQEIKRKEWMSRRRKLLGRG